MAKTRDEVSEFVRQIRFVGRSGGAVKSLSGFKKGRHTLPDVANATTLAFLAKLCAEELAEEAEAFFQRARLESGYKRKEIALDVASPAAVLTAKDFVFELAYDFAEGDPANYAVIRTLREASGRAWIESAACAAVFGGVFSEIAFALTKGAPVEAVIDAVEGLGDDESDAAGVKVDYPSDCSHCVLSVEGVAADVRFDGAELAMRFPRSGGPAELLEAFDAVRRAFALTKAKTLAGLIG